MKKRKLSVRMLEALAAFSLLIIAAVSLQLFQFYRRAKLEEYRKEIYAYARTASDFIDGDRVLTYVETGVKDEYYDSVQKFFDDTRRNAQMKYYYVFVPYENDLVYVWDGENDAQSQLGDREEYMNEYSFNAVKEEFVKDPPQELYVTDSDTYGFIATAYYPIYNSAGEPVAIVGVDLSVLGIYETILRFTLIIVLTVLGITILGGLVYYLYMNRQIVKPLSRLNDAAKDMVTGLDQEKTIDLDIHTGDELEELAGSFKTMYADLQEYIKKLSAVTKEKEQIRAELNVASRIQMDMLPQIFPPFPDHESFDLYATMNPAREVGGDFYDFFLIDENRLGLVIADVSGKGVPAALFMVIAKTLIKNRAMMGGGPAVILQDVNRQLCEEKESAMFVTVWFAILDINTGKGMAANAGHEHPVLRRKGGNYELVVYQHSPALGAMEGLFFREQEFTLAEGDRIFVYTDGVPEAANEANEQYGTDRMLKVMNAHPEAGLEELLNLVREDINSFVQGAEQFDDITMLALDYYGPAKPKPLEIECAATLENFTPVWEEVQKLLDQIGCPKKAAAQTELVLEELMSNVARYAYAPDIGKLKVTAVPLTDPRGIAITLQDQGVPYNPLEKEDPDVTLPVSERQVGGLGIYLVKNNVDDMKYEYKDGSNILTITKYF